MLPDAIDLKSVRRALVIKLRHHGDVLLTSPVFQTLKNHAPQIEIDALVYHDTREMLTGHPAIANVHTIDREWKRMGILSQASHEFGLYRAPATFHRYAPTPSPPTKSAISSPTPPSPSTTGR